MRTIAIMFVLITLIGCAEQSVIVTADAGVAGDGGMEEEDASFQEELDGGAGDGASPDAGPADSGTRTDSGPDAGPTDGGTDSGSVPDAASGDAGPDGSVPMPDASPVDAGAPVDAGPPRPVGDPVDVTGSRCALDEAGQFWCWGRWTPVEDVRLLGSGFDSAAGSCALRGAEVWCAEFSTLTMILVTDGSDTLRVERLAEYSDLALGCGVRRAGAWYRAVCWTNGGHPVFGSVTESGGGDPGIQVAVVAPGEPRTYIAGRGWPLTAVSTGTPEAYDINPDTICTSSGTRVDCSGYGRARGLQRPAGDHYVLGFSLSCANSSGVTRCSNGSSTLFDITTPSFTDQAVTWPVGAVDPTRPVQARGLCIGGDGIRCYTGFGTLSATLAYAVDW